MVCVESVMCMLAYVWHYGVSFDAVIWMPDQVLHDGACVEAVIKRPDHVWYYRFDDEPLCGCRVEPGMTGFVLRP